MRYTRENEDYVYELATKTNLTNKEIRDKFNKKFGQSRTTAGIRGLKTKLGATDTDICYTKEQVDYVKKIAPNETGKSLQEKFNKKFNQNRSMSALRSLRFREGVPLKSNGRLQKGHTPSNIKPIGAEKDGERGYIKVKVAMPDKWEHKHRLVWEKEYGKIPKGHVVIFGDGNASNLNIDNLLCIPRRQLVRLNKGDLIQNDAKLTKTMVNILELDERARKLAKEAEDE